METKYTILERYRCPSVRHIIVGGTICALLCQHHYELLNLISILLVAIGFHCGCIAGIFCSPSQSAFDHIFLVQMYQFRSRLMPWRGTYFLYTWFQNMPHLIKLCIKLCLLFLREMIILIHSDSRTVCFVGGSAGATAGFFSGSWLIGAVAGAVVGLVSYELVGKRLLKIQVK